MGLLLTSGTAAPAPAHRFHLSSEAWLLTPIPLQFCAHLWGSPLREVASALPTLVAWLCSRHHSITSAPWTPAGLMGNKSLFGFMV